MLKQVFLWIIPCEKSGIREYGLISLIDDAASQMGDFSRRTSYYGGMFLVIAPLLY